MVRRFKKFLNRQASASRGDADFRKRYDGIEHARVKMLQRLANLDAKAHAHPAFRRASTLLNRSFRKAKLAQRGAVLAAAEWTIDLLETLTFFV